MKNIILLLLVTLSSLSAISQDKGINLGVDLVSRYVWRGTDYGDSPSIQPYMSFYHRGLTLGSWGNYNANFKEMDLLVNYRLTDITDVTVTGYFTDSEETNHFHMNDYQVELGVKQYVKDVYISGNWFFANADDALYFEFGYDLQQVTLFVGMWDTLDASTNKRSTYVNNIGITGSKDLNFSEQLKLPLTCTLIVNPKEEQAHLVIGLTL